MTPLCHCLWYLGAAMPHVVGSGEPLSREAKREMPGMLDIPKLQSSTAFVYQAQ